MKTLPSGIVTGLMMGEEETYVFLFREYYVLLCAYARRYVGRKDIAEEIVSDTFYKIWENRHTIQINSSVKAYLFQAVCKNALYYLRKQKSENNLHLFFQDITAENIGFEETWEETDERSMLMENLSRRIEEAVSSLPQRQQWAFRLKRFEGKKIREIATTMGLSAKTVEMHLSKATLSLRQKLKDCLPTLFLLFLFN